MNVPAHKEYEFGWNRGNPHHYISRYEQSKDHRFRTRVRRNKVSKMEHFLKKLLRKTIFFRRNVKILK